MINALSTYVIRRWDVSQTPLDPDGSLVIIEGRAQGLTSILMSIVGIEPKLNFRVNDRFVRLERASLAGNIITLTPIDQVASLQSGLYRPIAGSVSIAAVVAFILSPLFVAMMGPALGVLGFLLGVVAGLLYYFFKKTNLLAYVDAGGWVQGLKFLPTVIQGKTISDATAGHAIEMVNWLATAARKK